MKIAKLIIDNILALSHLELDLQAPISIIVGPNEAGKSSIRDALAWVLTGQARGCKTHDEQVALIHQGAKAAEGTIVYDNGSKITRRKTLKSPPTVIGNVPDDQALTMALCDTHLFLSLPEKDRRAELFRLIPGLQPTAEDIAERLRVHAPDPNFSLSDLAVIAASKSFAAAETEAITRRRLAKRVRDGLQAKEPETVWNYSEDGVNIHTSYILPDIDTQVVDEGLAKLSAQRDKLLKKQGKVEGDLDKLPDLEAQLAALEIPDKSEEGAVQKREAELKKYRDALEEAITERDALEQGAPVQNFPEVCPVHNVPCPVSGNEAVAAVPAADPKKIGKLNATVTEWTAQVDREEEALEAAKKRQSDYDTAIGKRTELESKIIALKDQQARAAETAGLQSQIDALAGRIALGEELKDRVRQFWREKRGAEEAQTKIDNAEKEITLYDSLAKALAPSGIPSKLIAEALGPVNDLLARAAGHLFPKRIVTLTQDLEVMLSGSPFATLSKSARFRVGVAFQYCLAKLAGARLLLCDEVDMLDPPNRAALVSFLLEIQPEFDNILAFATSDHAAPSSDPEVQIWVMLAGKAYPLNPGFEYADGRIIPEGKAA